MNLKTAFDIVLDLAKQNQLNAEQVDYALVDEAFKQELAINEIELFLEEFFRNFPILMEDESETKTNC